MPRFEAHPLRSEAFARLDSEVIWKMSVQASLRKAKAPHSSRLGLSAWQKIVQHT
jgi:hypothetical protein